MAPETTTDDEAQTDDLTNLTPSVGFRRTGNNERMWVYPDAPGAKHGVIRHDYDGLPARGTILYDVTGYDIVDMDFEVGDENTTMAEEFDHWEVEFREWIEGALFDTSLGATEANFSDEGGHTITLKNPWEGDEFTVELETENKRRVV